MFKLTDGEPGFDGKLGQGEDGNDQGKSDGEMQGRIKRVSHSSFGASTRRLLTEADLFPYDFTSPSSFVLPDVGPT